MAKYQLVFDGKGKQYVREYGMWIGLTILIIIMCIGISISSEPASTRLGYCLLLLFLAIPMLKYPFMGYQYYNDPQTLIIDGKSISLSTLLYLEPFAFVSFILSNGQCKVKLTFSDPCVEAMGKERSILRLRESKKRRFSAITANGKAHAWSKYEMRDLCYRDEGGKTVPLSEILVGSGFVTQIEPHEPKQVEIDLYGLNAGKKMKDMLWMMRHKKEIRELNIDQLSTHGSQEKSLDESVSEIKRIMDHPDEE